MEYGSSLVRFLLRGRSCGLCTTFLGGGKIGSESSSCVSSEGSLMFSGSGNFGIAASIFEMRRLDALYT